MPESRFPFPGYPTGWFAVALSGDLPPNEPLRLHYFGRELVAYRGESGSAYVVNAHCPHLGAHLGHGGKIEGDSIRCPYHGWRFESDGRCAEIPYSDRIPGNARLRSYPVCEQNGVVHMFYDPLERTPWAIPELPDVGWTPHRSVLWAGLRTHPQEVFENTVDVAHIGPVHHGQRARLSGPPVRDGVRLDIGVEFDAPGDIVGMPGEINDVHLSVTMWGVGCTHVETHVRNVGIRARQHIYATPVDEHSIDLRGMLQVRATDDPVFTRELAETFYDAYVEDFAKDFPIWENKRYLTEPGLTSGDGPIGLYRQWCRQFYVQSNGKSAERSVARGARSSDVVADLKRRVFDPAKRRLKLLFGRSDETAQPMATNGGASSPAPKASARKATRPVATAEEYFATLNERFVPAAAKGVDAVFQWELTGDGGRTFHAQVRDGAIEIQSGAHIRPTVSLVIGAEDYVRVVNGELDGTWAFTNGRGKVQGSVRAAMKMRSLFPA